MNMATQTIIAQEQDERNRRMLHAYMESFWQRWAPDDRREAAEFHADLQNIIRQVYREAQEPLLKHINAVAMLAPFPPAHKEKS